MDAPAAPTPKRGRPSTDPGGQERADVLANRALELRMAGATYAQIADALGYAGRQQAHKAAQRALRKEMDRLAGDREDFARLHLARTERLIRAHWTAALAGDAAATAEVRRLLERQARMLGLDRPVKVEVTDAMDAEIESLVQEMQRLAAVQAAQPDTPTSPEGVLPDAPPTP